MAENAENAAFFVKFVENEIHRVYSATNKMKPQLAKDGKKRLFCRGSTRITQIIRSFALSALSA